MANSMASWPIGHMSSCTGPLLLSGLTACVPANFSSSFTPTNELADRLPKFKGNMHGWCDFNQLAAYKYSYSWQCNQVAVYKYSWQGKDRGLFSSSTAMHLMT
ncbi:hypothetical protein ABZP36_008010 [Zizania latifolia]